MKKKYCFIGIVIITCMLLSACGKSEAVKQTEELINSIGEVSLESEEAIIEAETAYNDLSDQEKEKVENNSLLTSAREKVDLLIKETEPFHEFSKDMTYKEVVEFFNDNIRERDEDYIETENINILEGIPGFYDVYFNDGIVSDVHFWVDYRDSEGSLELDDMASSTIANYYDEKYGESQEQWYVQDIVSVGKDPSIQIVSHEYYTIRKWVDYNGYVIIEERNMGYSLNDDSPHISPLSVILMFFLDQEEYDSHMSHRTYIPVDDFLNE